MSVTSAARAMGAALAQVGAEVEKTVDTLGTAAAAVQKHTDTMGQLLDRVRDIAKQSPALIVQVEKIIQAFQSKELSRENTEALRRTLGDLLEQMRVFQGAAPGLTGDLADIKNQLEGALGQELEKLLRR